MRCFLFVLSLLASDALAQPAAQPAPRFRAGAEVIVIDVTVIDNHGVPVDNLTAADFAVTVNNKPRAIQSAQFMRSEAAGTSPLPDESSNSEPSSGRLLLIVIDEATLRPGTSHLVAAGRGLLTRLGPGDLVGVARIPDGGGVAFTTNRSRIVEELQRLTPGRARAMGVGPTVYLSEAVDREGSRRFQWPAAVKRECGEAHTGAEYRACVASLDQAARSLLLDESLKTRNTVRALEQLMKNLAATQQPVTLVLISERLFVGQDPGVLTALTTAGAEARVSLHVVQPALPGIDLGAHGFPSDPLTDDQLQAEGLEMIAAQSRGTFDRAVATGAAIFDRISRESSGYYLLGIESMAEDRRQRHSRVRVDIRRKGLTVRARSMVAWPDGGTALPLDTGRRLQQLLEAPVPVAGLPLRITARAVSSDDANRVRVLLAAEIGDVTDGEARYHVGLLAIDDKGAVMERTAATLSLPPSRPGRQSPSEFTTSLLLEPGRYSVRLAAIGTDGRSGSVHHDVRGSLHEWPDGLRSSDLIVASEPPPREFPRVNASSIVVGPRVASILELVHDDPRVLARCGVRFSVGGKSVEATAAAAAPSASRYRRSFAAILTMETLGLHRLTATITPPSGKSVSLDRAFSFQPAVSEMTHTLPDLDTTRGFIEALERRAGVSPSLVPFVAAAKVGRYIDAPEAESRADADVAMVTFVNGLAAVRDRKPALAWALFQQTLRKVPDFEGAVFYLSLLK